MNILLFMLILGLQDYSVSALYINTDHYSVVSEYVSFSDSELVSIEDSLKAYAYSVYSENEQFMIETANLFDTIDFYYVSESRINRISRVNDYISIEYYLQSYTGGAHGIHNYSTFLYDINTSATVLLEEIITEEQLVEIAAFCREQISLEKMTQDEDYDNSESDDFLIEGTAPLWDNYKCFVMYEDSIVFTFNEYRVAPYYMGAFMVAVPDTVYMEKAEH